MSDTVPVHVWLNSAGKDYGCGTACEFNYWLAQGVNPEGSRLGAVLTHEPYAEDARRIRAWGLDGADAEQFLPADHPLLRHESGPPVSMGRAARKTLDPR
jgi:hypothetical protein